MRSYIYESFKLSNGGRYVVRYTPAEGIVYSIIKFLFFLFLIWPFQLFVWWPIKIMFKGFLIVCELILRSIWWLIKLPFCLLFMHKCPKF